MKCRKDLVLWCKITGLNMTIQLDPFLKKKNRIEVSYTSPQFYNFYFVLYFFPSLRMKPSYIPFRESKLTRLFQPFFCGKGKACMIVNINQHPSTYDETLHVMKFSAIARQVRVHLLSMLVCLFFLVTGDLWNDQVVWIWVGFEFLIHHISSSACGLSLKGF